MRENRDKMEVWLGQHLLLAIDSSMQPSKGDLINIRGATYEVKAKSYTIDHADDLLLKSARCNIIVRRADA